MRQKVILVAVISALFFFNVGRIWGQDYKVTWSNEKVLPFEYVGQPQLSPDGSRLIFLKNVAPNYDEAESHLWIANSDGSFARNLLFTDVMIRDHATFRVVEPLWSPDGKSVVFEEIGPRVGPNAIRIMEFGKTGWPYITGTGPSQMEYHFSGWFPDGKKFIYSSGSTSYVVNLITKETKVFGEGIIGRVSFSPDGNTIVDFGKDFVTRKRYLTFYDLQGNIKDKKEVNFNYTSRVDPVWAPNGKYIILDNTLYVMSSGAEIPFLPDNIVRYTENGKTYVGPGEVAISKDGRKIAFGMWHIENGDLKGSKIKVMDLVWKD